MNRVATLLFLGVVLGCGQSATQKASSAPPPAPVDAKTLPGTYQIYPVGGKKGTELGVEALLLQKDGTFNIVFRKMTYGYYTVGKWTIDKDQIHLFPSTVDQKDLAKTEADLQSGKIPSTEKTRLELMFKDRLLT